MALTQEQLKKMEAELSKVLTFTRAGWPVIDSDGLSGFVLEHAKELFEALRMAQGVAQNSVISVKGNEEHE